MCFKPLSKLLDTSTLAFAAWAFRDADATKSAASFLLDLIFVLVVRWFRWTRWFLLQNKYFEGIFIEGTGVCITIIFHVLLIMEMSEQMVSEQLFLEDSLPDPGSATALLHVLGQFSASTARVAQECPCWLLTPKILVIHIYVCVSVCVYLFIYLYLLANCMYSWYNMYTHIYVDIHGIIVYFYMYTYSYIWIWEFVRRLTVFPESKYL